MEPPPSRAQTYAILSPNIRRTKSERGAKVADHQNCPFRIARPELNYNLASFGGGKNGGGQAWTGLDRLFQNSQESLLY